MSTKVLVFEHDAGFASELRKELSRLGCVVSVVDDGNAGLAQAASDRPDLILLSIELPRMNGFSVCNKLKKDPQLKDVPLIIMSSESSEETFEQHKKLRTRAEDYVHKPIAFGELLQHMRTFVPGIEANGASGGDDIVIDEEIAIGELDDDNEMTQVGSLPPDLRAQLKAHSGGRNPTPAPARPRDAEVDAFADAAFDNLLGGQAAPNTAPAPAPAAQRSSRSNPGTPAAAPTQPTQPEGGGEVDRLRGIADKARSDAQRLERELAASRGEVAKLSAVQQRLRDQEEANSKLLTELAEAKEAASAASHSSSEDTTREDEVAHLRKDLEDARAEARRVHEGVEARASMLEEETKRLQKELDAAKLRTSAPSVAPGAPTGRTSGVSTREFLELRESLNKKDKEILKLRDEINGQEKGVLDLKDRFFQLERSNVELDEKYGELQTKLAEAQTQLNAAKADKDQAQKRGDDFSKRFERVKTDAESAQKELAAEKERAQKVVAEIAAARDQQLQTELAKLRADLEAAHEATLAARDKAHADETSRLRGEHEAATTESNERQRRELVESQEASLEARAAAVEKREREVREEMESKLAVARGEGATALAAAERVADERIAEAARDRDAAVAAANRERDEQLAAAERARLAAIEAAHSDRDVKVAAAEQARAELDELRQRELAEAEARRMRELADAEARRARELAEAEEIRQREAAEAEEGRQRELTEAEQRRVHELGEATARLRQELEAEKEAATSGLRSSHAQQLGAAAEEREKERNALRAEIAELEGVLARANSDLQNERKRTASLEQDLTARAAAVDGLSKELGDARGKIGTLEQELIAVGTELANTRATLDDEATRARRQLEKWDRDRVSLERAKDALAEALTRIEEAEDRAP